MTYFPGTKRSVETGETYFGELDKTNISGKHNRSRKRPKADSLADGEPLMARIDHARFIVDCPNCGSAEFYFEDNLFYCTVCGNSDVGGKVKRVVTPGNRVAIEKALGKRPIKNRNWNPGETVKDLESENLKHGVV